MQETAKSKTKCIKATQYNQTPNVKTLIRCNNTMSESKFKIIIADDGIQIKPCSLKLHLTITSGLVGIITLSLIGSAQIIMTLLNP